MSGDGPTWTRALEGLFKPRRLAAIWLVALLVLLLPRRLWAALRVEAFVEQYRGWILGAFLVVLSLWTLELLPAAVGRWRGRRRETRRIRRTLDSLTLPEKALLVEMYERGAKTFQLPALSDLPGLLEGRGLVVRLSYAMNSVDYYFEVPDRVWTELGRMCRRRRIQKKKSRGEITTLVG